MVKEFQYYDVGNKPKQTFTKRGHLYTRKGYDIRVDTANRFSKKCDLLGESESRTIERLVEAFLTANGWGPECKQGSFLEPNIANHIKDAAHQVTKDLRY